MDLLAILCLHALAALPMAVALRAALMERRLYAFVFLGMLAYQLLMLPSLPALVEEFGTEVVFRGELISLLGASVLAASVAILERSNASSRLFRPNPVIGAAAEWRVYLLTIAPCMVAISAIIARRGEDLLWANWEALRGEATRLDSVATLLQFLVIPSAWIAFRSGRKLVAAGCLAFALVLFSALGSRAALLTLPAVVALDLYRSRLDARRVRVVVVGLVLVAAALHAIGRIVRGFGLSGLYLLVTGDLLDIGQLAGLLSEIEWAGGETEIARYFFVAVRDAPIADALPLSSPFRWLTSYLPRDLFGDFKPEDITYVLWRHCANAGVFDGYASWTDMLGLLRSGESGSVHPTLWGEMWLNGGIQAVPIFCLVLAGWLVFADRLFIRLPAALEALVGPALVVGYLMVARGNSAIGLGYVAYLLPAAALLFFGARRIERALARGDQARDPASRGSR